MSFISGNWRSEMQTVAQAQDDAFGEPFSLFPMSVPINGSAVRDTGRPVLNDVIGIFTDEADVFELDQFRPKIATSKPSVTFHRSRLTWLPKRGDIVRRHIDGAQYEVKDQRPDGVSRVMFELHQMGVPKR